jgi:hypothetical protein
MQVYMSAMPLLHFEVNEAIGLYEPLLPALSK